MIVTFVIGFFYIISVHIISLQMDRDGFSIFAKKELVDDKLYYLTTKELTSQLANDGMVDVDSIYDMQTSNFGYHSSKSLYFSAIAVPFYFFFPDSGPLAFKLLNVFFFAMTVLCFIKFFKVSGLGVSENHPKGYSKVPAELFFLLIVISIYPTYIIRMVQLEKDLLLGLLFISLFLVMLANIEVGKRYKFKDYVFISFLLSMLFLYRPQYGLSFFILFFYRVMFSTSSYKVFLSQLVLLFLLAPVPILIIGKLYPAIFEVLVAHKRYSVLAGVTGVIDADYSGYISTLKTLSISLYYFYLAPISKYAVQSNMMWKLLMLEPLVFFVIPFVISCCFHKYTQNGRKVMFFAILLSLILGLLSVYFESHVGSYIRKRMPLYLMWIFLSFYFLNAKKKFNNSYFMGS